jgi:hypothetical protein
MENNKWRKIKYKGIILYTNGITMKDENGIEIDNRILKKIIEREENINNLLNEN